MKRIGKNDLNSDIVSYYKDRAKEYDAIYNKPERQDDLLQVEQFLKMVFKEKEVFEIACGTGYWTQKIAATATNILATDINESVIEIAEKKNYLPCEVEFKIADIFNLEAVNKHESLFGGFIWSHIKLQELNNFISILNSCVTKDGIVVLIDNNYVAGSNLPLSEKDDSGNTYQTRTLDNGTTHKVLKNFPTEIFIRGLMKQKASDICFINLEYYWILKYKAL